MAKSNEELLDELLQAHVAKHVNRFNKEKGDLPTRADTLKEEVLRRMRNNQGTEKVRPVSEPEITRFLNEMAQIAG